MKERTGGALLLFYFYWTWFEHYRATYLTNLASSQLDRFPTALPLPDSPLSPFSLGVLQYLLGMAALGAVLYPRPRWIIRVLALELICKLYFWSLDRALWREDHLLHLFWTAIFLCAHDRVRMLRVGVAAGWLGAALAQPELAVVGVLPWFWFAPWARARWLSGGLCCALAGLLALTGAQDTVLLLFLGTLWAFVTEPRPLAGLWDKRNLVAWILALTLVVAGSAARILPLPPAARVWTLDGHRVRLEGRALYLDEMRVREPVLENGRVILNPRAYGRIPLEMPVP